MSEELEQLDERLLSNSPEDLAQWRPLVVRRDQLIRQLSGAGETAAALDRSQRIESQLRLRRAEIRAELERLFQSRVLLRAFSSGLSG